MRGKCIKAFRIMPLLCLLPIRGGFAESAEGVRVAGSHIPYILGGIAIMALGVLIGIGMIVSGRERREMILICGIFPAFLLPMVAGIGAGIGLMKKTPPDTYVMNGIGYRLYEDHAVANGFAKDSVYYNAAVPAELEGTDIDPADILVLPDLADGLPLKSVGGFAGAAVKAVCLPYTVITVQGSAFRDCGALETVVQKEPTEDERAKAPYRSVSIGDHAFEGCAALRRAAFSGRDAGKPVSCSVGESAFSGCASLETLENCTVIKPEKRAFADSGLTEIRLGEIRESGGGCFEGCGRLRAVTLPEKTETVSSAMFRNCTALETVDLGSARRIAEEAFAGCTSLKIVCASGNTRDACRVEEKAFENCGSLRLVWLDRVSACAADAFAGCPEAKLYMTYADAATEKNAAKAGIPIAGEDVWRAELLPDGTLSLEELLAGGKTDTLTVPAAYGGLKVGRVTVRFGQNGRDWEELTVEDGVREIQLNGRTDMLEAVSLPLSAESTEISFEGREWKREIRIRTGNETVIGYLRQQRLIQPEGCWTVVPAE